MSESLQPLSIALFNGDIIWRAARRYHYHDKSQIVDPLNGLASLVRSQMRWIQLGLLQPIQPKIVYQPGKTHVIIAALSRSMPPTQTK